MSNQHRGRRERPQKQRHKHAGPQTVRFVTNRDTDVLEPDQKAALVAWCGHLDTATEPLEAEQIASRLLGRMWEIRHRVFELGFTDWAYHLGAPVAREVARIGGIGAKGFLLTLAHQDPGRLGEVCLDLALGPPLDDVPVPDWARETRFAELTHAASDKRPGDGEAFVIEVRRGRHQAFSMMSLVDERKGGLATRLALIRPFDELPEFRDPNTPPPPTGMSFSPCGLEYACQRLKTAMELTDAADDPPVEDEYALLRALVLARISPYALLWRKEEAAAVNA